MSNLGRNPVEVANASLGRCNLLPDGEIKNSLRPNINGLCASLQELSCTISDNISGEYPTLTTHVNVRHGLQETKNKPIKKTKQDRNFLLKQKHIKDQPNVLNLSVIQLQKLYHDPFSLPGLYQGLAFNASYVNDNGELIDGRRKREEGRFNLFNLAKVILHHLNLVTMKPGWVDNYNNFTPFTLSWLADKAGISLDSAYRAISIMRKAGLILCTQHNVQQADNPEQFRTNYVDYYLDESFFKLLGLYEEFLQARELALKLHHKREIKASIKRAELAVYCPTRIDHIEKMVLEGKGSLRIVKTVKRVRPITEILSSINSPLPRSLKPEIKTASSSKSGYHNPNTPANSREFISKVMYRYNQILSENPNIPKEEALQLAKAQLARNTS